MTPLVLLLGLTLATDPALDRYGDPLPDGTVARLGTTRLRDGVGDHVVYSADGKRLATGTERELAVWDAASGKRLATYPVPTDPRGHPLFHNLARLAFAPDGRALAGVFTLGGVLVFPAEGDPVRLPTRSPDGLHFADFLPDGKRLVAVGTWGVRIYEAATGRVEREWRADDGVPAGAAFGSAALSPDGKVLAVASGRGGRPDGVRLWDVATGEELARSDAPAALVAFGGDGTLATFAFAEREVRLLDPLTGARRAAFPVRPGRPGQKPCLFLSADGKTFACWGHLYETATGKLLRPFGSDANQLGQYAAFSPDGRHLAVTWGYLGAAEVTDLATGEPVGPLEAHAAPPTGVLLPDGKTFATASLDGTVRRWDPRTGRHLGRFRFTDGYVYTRAFGGRWFAHNEVARIRVFDVERGAIGHTLEPLGSTGELALSADGRVLLCVAGNVQRSVQVWDVATEERLGDLAHPDEQVSRLAVSPAGSVAAVATHAGGLRLFDTTTGRLTFDLQKTGPGGAGSDALAFSPDGRFLATGGSAVRLWDVATGRLVRAGPLYTPPAAGARRWINHVVFSPDGRMIGSAGPGDTFRVWETATLRERFRWDGGGFPVAFTPDGLLVTGHGRPDLLVRDLPALATAAKPADPWAALAEEDAAAAYRAVRHLAGLRDGALPLLRDRLRPVPAADADRVRRLINDLDAEAFETRDDAARELALLGEPVVPALAAAAKVATSAEQRRRLGELLERGVGFEPERARVLRAIEALEAIGTPARAVLQSLATGAPDAEATRQAKAALERLGTRP